MDETSERDLVARAKCGDQTGFAGLAEQYRNLVLSLAYQTTLSAADTDDLAQEAFLRAFQHLGSYRGEASFKTWLVRIVMNVCSNYRRSLKREGGSETLEIQMLPAPDAGPEQQALGAELQKHVRRAVADLPAHYRSVVVLRDFHSLSYLKIAEVLGIPAGTVMSRLAKAREHLRAGLATYWRGT
jgi:RNA polymerase sigma-70 factor (ECF subfamily)